MEKKLLVEIKDVLQECRPYIISVNHEAEAEYDSFDTDTYMGSAQYEVMEKTEKLVRKIDKLLQKM